jgi:UDP-N-acetylglucosamine acyltransferase
LTRIAEGASVHPDAQIAEDVEIGAFSVIGPHVKIGRGTRIGANCSIDGHTTIGEHNRIFSHVAIGGEPQDLKHRGEPTRLEIGDHNTIREFVTINTGTVSGGGLTRMGSYNMLMACAHVAHDCQLQDRIIISNNSLLGGHIHVESDVIISGASAVHHFATLGRGCFIGGMTRVSRDVPPFMTFAGTPPKVIGPNMVGLKRRGYGHDEVSALKEAHRYFFRSGLTFNEALEECRDLIAMFPAVRILVEALKLTQNGKFGRAREALRTFD